MKGKFGSLALFNVMLAATIIITGIVFIEPLKDMIEIGRTGLSCGTPGLSYFVEMTCIVTGISLPMFVGIVFGVGIAFIAAKKLGVFGGGQN